MMTTDFFYLLIAGVFVTLKLALVSLLLGMAFGLLTFALQTVPIRTVRLITKSIIFLIRGLPELLILFFIYFGLSTLLSQLFNHYIDISPFAAGVAALSLIFGAYASQVFRGAFKAVEVGQLEAGRALGLNRQQLFFRIHLPQAWRHAIPGLGNLWLILLKDTAIVSLIGLSEIMSQAKLAASTTHQPFTFYLLAACLYLAITVCSQQFINYFTYRSNRYLSS